MHTSYMWILSGLVAAVPNVLPDQVAAVPARVWRIIEGPSRSAQIGSVVDASDAVRAALRVLLREYDVSTPGVRKTIARIVVQGGPSLFKAEDTYSEAVEVFRRDGMVSINTIHEGNCLRGESIAAEGLTLYTGDGALASPLVARMLAFTNDIVPQENIIATINTNQGSISGALAFASAMRILRGDDPLLSESLLWQLHRYGDQYARREALIALGVTPKALPYESIQRLLGIACDSGAAFEERLLAWRACRLAAVQLSRSELRSLIPGLLSEMKRSSDAVTWVGCVQILGEALRDVSLSSGVDLEASVLFHDLADEIIKQKRAESPCVIIGYAGLGRVLPVARNEFYKLANALAPSLDEEGLEDSVAAALAMGAALLGDHSRLIQLRGHSESFRWQISWLEYACLSDVMPPLRSLESCIAFSPSVVGSPSVAEVMIRQYGAEAVSELLWDIFDLETTRERGSATRAMACLAALAEIGDSSDLTLLVEMLDNDRYAVYKILIAEVIIGIARRKEWSHCALSKALQQLRESEHSQRILEFAP